MQRKAKPPAAVGVLEPIEESSDEALAPEPANAAPPDLDRIRNAVCAALDSEGHNTAAAQILNGDWTEKGNAIQVELPLRKAMLALTVNAEAEAICKKAAIRSYRLCVSWRGPRRIAPLRSRA